MPIQIPKTSLLQCVNTNVAQSSNYAQPSFSIKRIREPLSNDILSKLRSAVPVMIDTALEAGMMAKKYREAGDIPYEIKQDGSKVTKAEKEIQRVILEKLTSRFSDFGFIAEEILEGQAALKFNENINSPYKWVIDPIDGSSNFIKKDKNFFGTAIALMYENDFIATVFYAPEYEIDGKQGIFIVASELEDSVYLNGKKVFIDLTKEDLKNREVLLDNYPPLNHKEIKLNTKNFKENYSIKSSSLCLTLISSGKEDTPVALESKTSKLWDGVGLYLIEKAGGVVWDIDGRFILPLNNNNFNSKTSTIEAHIFAGHPNAIKELLSKK